MEIPVHLKLISLLLFKTDNTARTQAGVRAIKKKLQVVTISSIPITGAYATLRYARHQNQMVGPRYKKLKEEAEKKK
jgi:hypothetical protein